MDGWPPLTGDHLPESGTIGGSAAVSGWGPNSKPVGASLPWYPGSGKSPRGAPRTTSPRLGACLANTSTLSVGRGEEAVGSESLFRSDGPKVSSDEDTSMRAREGLHNNAQRDKKRYNKTYQELLWYPDTYDFASGLSLGNHSSSL